MGQQAWPLYKRVLMLDRPADCRTGRLVAQRDLLRGRPEQLYCDNKAKAFHNLQPLRAYRIHFLFSKTSERSGSLLQAVRFIGAPQDKY
jgi:hypothetical protein